MRDITLKIDNEVELDIRIDERQRIKDTLDVLIENGKIESREEIQKVYSVRKGVYVNVWLTYEQANIFGGDRIVLADRRQI